MMMQSRHNVFSCYCWIMVFCIGVAASGFEAAAQTGANDSSQTDVPVNDTVAVPDGASDDLADLSLEELMNVQVVVTASRRAQRISQVPYAMSVITAADIRASGARSIPDALRLVPGVDVADLSYGNAAVSPRGFHGFIASQVLVLVDGRQIFDSLFGGTLWGGWPFQMEDIERIEVIRGPGGVTWGANAINGVINIITKDPADQLGLTVTLSGGSRGSFKQHIGYSFQEGKLRMRISGEYEASDGFLKGGSFLRNLEDDYKGGRLNLHGIYELSDTETVTFSVGSALVDGGSPPTPLAGLGLRRNSAQQSFFALVKLERQISENEQIDLTIFVNDFFATPGLSQFVYRYQQIGLQLSHTIQLNDTHTQTWGIDTRLDLLDAGNSHPSMLTKNFVTTGTVAAYLQNEWRLAPLWTLNVGARIDYESYGGFQPSARVSLVHQLSERETIYGAVSRAFTMPTGAGRFLNIPMLNGLSRVTSTRGTDPTTLLAYELGYRGRLSDRFDLNLNLFWNQYDEVTTLSPTLGPPGLLQFRFRNRSGNVSLYGFEMEAEYRVTEKLTLLANYTYQQLNWDVDVPFTDRDFITPPKHKFMLAARHTLNDDVRLSAHLFYVDAVESPNPSNPFAPRHVDPYLRLDLRAEFDLRDDKGSIAVGVQNLLDSGHYEGSTLFINDAEVPRMVFAELRLFTK